MTMINFSSRSDCRKPSFVLSHDACDLSRASFGLSRGLLRPVARTLATCREDSCDLSRALLRDVAGLLRANCCGIPPSLLLHNMVSSITSSSSSSRMRKSSRIVITDLAQAHGFLLLLLLCMGSMLLLIRNSSSFMFCHHPGFIRNGNSSSSSSSSNPDADADTDRVSVVGNQELQKDSTGSRFTKETVLLSDHHEESSASSKLLTILLGVVMTSSKVERRSLLRLAYGLQNAAPFAEIAVRFVVCKPESEREKLVVGMERLQYNDILVLDCEENTNHGKTFVYLSSVAAMGIRYDYVMKADDDSYVRLQNLGKSLSEQPRNDLYYGSILPCENPDAYAWYMAGMGYVLSWDLVEWVHDSPIPKNNSEGTEDRLLGEWLNAGGVAKNRVSNKPLFYDHPDFGGKCAHELVPETILVHQLKTSQRWTQVLSFFEHDRIDLFNP